MKKIFSTLFALSVILFTTWALADVITNEVYFAIREQFRKENPSEFRIRKVCERIEGERVDLSSKVITIRKSGVIRADMDTDFWSMPDITLTLKNPDSAEEVREGSMIYYTGVVENCRFSTNTGSLDFDISGGVLKRHY